MLEQIGTDSLVAQPGVLHGWELGIPGVWYFVYALGVSLFTRVVLAALKASEIPTSSRVTKLKGFWDSFKDAFLNRVALKPSTVVPDDTKPGSQIVLADVELSDEAKGDVEPSDKTEGTPRPNFSSAILGVAETLAYPVLLHQNQLTAIGLWVGLKTAGGWKGWTDSRAEFLRFLIGNILVIGFSIFAAYAFIR